MNRAKHQTLMLMGFYLDPQGANFNMLENPSLSTSEMNFKGRNTLTCKQLADANAVLLVRIQVAPKVVDWAP